MSCTVTSRVGASVTSFSTVAMGGATRGNSSGGKIP